MKDQFSIKPSTIVYSFHLSIPYGCGNIYNIVFSLSLFLFCNYTTFVMFDIIRYLFGRQLGMNSI